ncbi:hypothetical protein IKN40_04175, partial [bacterium]|nr:hypothetical protein [bacterium]
MIIRWGLKHKDIVYKFSSLEILRRYFVSLFIAPIIIIPYKISIMRSKSLQAKGLRIAKYGDTLIAELKTRNKPDSTLNDNDYKLYTDYICKYNKYLEETKIFKRNLDFRAARLCNFIKYHFI